MPVDRLVGVDRTDPRLPQSVIDATVGTGPDDLAPGDTLAAAKAYADSVAGTGGGGGTDADAVHSSTAGDGPPVETIAVYTGDGFATLVDRDPNTYYVVTPPGGGVGSVYLGNTLILGQLLAAPSTVPLVSASPGDTQVGVAWGTPNTGGLVLSGYTIERSTSAVSGFAAVATVAGSVHNYTSTGLTNGTTYYFRVTATNAMGTSGPSSVASATPVSTSTTTLTSSDDTSEGGASVTFTATVTSGGSPAVGGGVTFKRGGNIMTSGVTLTAGVATYTTSAIPIGSHAITAVYDGGTNYLPSTSNTVTQTVGFAGGPAPTTAVLTSDDASSTTGQLVTFTLTVTRTADAVAVGSGSAVFRDGGVAISAPTIVTPAGISTFTTSTLSDGTHDVTAQYSGAPFYENSLSNSVSQVVAAGTGSLPIAQAMYSSKPLANVGEVVTLRTTIRSGTDPVTEGTVVFKDGDTVLGAGTALNVLGEAAYTTTALAVGTHTITAEYSGAPTFEDDVSAAFVQTVSASIPAPSPNTWEAAFASNNLATITAWYDYNTGHLAEGFNPANLWRPPGIGVNDRVTVNAAWLAAHAAPGRVVNDSGSHWTITGLHATQIRVATSNLTFNHCYVDRQDYAHIWEAGVFVLEDVTVSGTQKTTYHNIVLNYCTIATDGTNADGSYGDAIEFVPVDPPIADNFVANHCEVTLWRAGFLSWTGVTVSYCWVHDLNLFSFDPHNTSASIRGAQCRFYRNLFADGTSSDVSLYADTNPYTDFWVTENTMWVDPNHAIYEINFPNRATGFAPLLPGYVRELVGNKIQRGGATDNQYWSKISGNTLISGEQLFGGADTVQTPGVPTVLAGPSSADQFGAAPTLISYHYTPSPSSTLLCFLGIGRANHVQNPNVNIGDESGALWALVSGTETPVEAEPGNLLQYGLSGSVWTMQTSGSPQAFRRLNIDPYQTTANNAYMAATVVELTGVTGLTLAKPAVVSTAGHSTAFGAFTSTITTGTLSSAATSGHLVMLFVSYQHDEFGTIGVPSGWNVLGNRRDPKTSTAVLWRTNFTGTSVTLSDLGPTKNIVTILCEFA